jgi:hypothetical protein
MISNAMNNTMADAIRELEISVSVEVAVSSRWIVPMAYRVFFNWGTTDILMMIEQAQLNDDTILSKLLHSKIDDTHRSLHVGLELGAGCLDKNNCSVSFQLKPYALRLEEEIVFSLESSVGPIADLSVASFFDDQSLHVNGAAGQRHAVGLMGLARYYANITQSNGITQVQLHGAASSWCCLL